MKLIQKNLYVADSPVHGMGVFAGKEINQGEIVEECYSLLASNDANHFEDYFFSITGGNCLPLGFGAIYNHSSTPNLTYIYKPEEKVIVFKALKSIAADEELLISYGDDWFSSRDIMPLQTSWRFRLKKIFHPTKSLFMRSIIVVVLCWNASALIKIVLH